MNCPTCHREGYELPVVIKVSPRRRRHLSGAEARDRIASYRTQFFEIYGKMPTLNQTAIKLGYKDHTVIIYHLRRMQEHV